MIGMEILKPVAVLAAWTMVMWLWMYFTRVPAMKKARIDIGKLTGGTGRALDDLLPGKVQWIAHNYNHLHEAPTVFYAVALSLARFLLFVLSSIVLIMLVVHLVLAVFGR
jgi:hypothetical protein